MRKIKAGEIAHDERTGAVRFTGEAARTMRRLMRVTHRTADEVLSRALRAFLLKHA